MNTDDRTPPRALSEEEIERRLDDEPDLFKRFASGDTRVLAQLVEKGTGAKVRSHVTRLPAH